MSTIEDDLPEYWPRIGDRLFVQNSCRTNADIATYRGERLYRMKKAFKTSADLLVYQSEQDANERRNLVWPIVFCYRHYIELALKDMINKYGSQVVTEIKPDWKSHSLQDLWKSYKIIVKSTLSEFNINDIPEVAAVGACILELNNIDAGSFTFRYPTDKDGKQTEIPFTSIDLSHLRNVMEGIYAFLDCTESELEAQFQNNHP